MTYQTLHNITVEVETQYIEAQSEPGQTCFSVFLSVGGPPALGPEAGGAAPGGAPAPDPE